MNTFAHIRKIEMQIDNDNLNCFLNSLSSRSPSPLAPQANFWNFPLKGEKKKKKKKTTTSCYKRLDQSHHTGAHFANVLE